MLADQKKLIDLADVVEFSGIHLKKSGKNLVGLCPFHNEKTPSFYVFPDHHYKCFSCQVYGDSIDFVRKMYGLSFPDALKHLGIEQGHITPKMHRSIEQRKRKAELLKKFNKWQSRYSGYLGTMINRTQKLLKGITPDDLELYASLLNALPVWKYHSHILVEGSDKEKFQLYKEAQKNERF